jgi:hypothetical protein
MHVVRAIAQIAAQRRRPRLVPWLAMAAKRAKKQAAGKKSTAKAKPTKPTAKPPKRTKPTAPKAKSKAKANAPPAIAVVKKPKRPAKANKPPAIPHQKTIFIKEEKPPPRPKATIPRAKAVALANTFLKENVGKAALYAPRASRFRLGSIVDQDGIINVLFCHEADDHDPVIKGLGTKCLDALVAAHPQLRAFDIQVQTIRM